MGQFESMAVRGRKREVVIKVMGDIKSEAGKTGKVAVKTCLDNGLQEVEEVAVKD